MTTKNIFADMLVRVHRANDDLIAAGLLPSGIDQSRVTVEPPRDPTHGDIATNAAMVLAKDAKRKPRERRSDSRRHIAVRHRSVARHRRAAARSDPRRHRDQRSDGAGERRQA
jgi:arginyl-tRNA synthetase